MCCRGCAVWLDGYLDNIGRSTLTGSVAQVSSRRWKTNIQTLQGSLYRVERLRGVSYDWKQDGRHGSGVIAEEIGLVVPEVVEFEANGVDAKSVNYGHIAVLLIEAMKE